MTKPADLVESSSDFAVAQDKTCLRIDEASKDWLIREAGRRQMESGEIVSINDLIVDIIAQDIGYVVPDYKMQKNRNPRNDDRPTYIPPLPPGMREHWERSLRRMQQMRGGKKVDKSEHLMVIVKEMQGALDTKTSVSKPKRHM